MREYEISVMTIRHLPIFRQSFQSISQTSSPWMEETFPFRRNNGGLGKN